MADAESYGAALASLFSRDPEAQQRANTWLNAFSSTSGAWEAGLASLDPRVPVEALFFSANMLLDKTRREFVRLTPEQRHNVNQAVSAKLQLFLSMPDRIPSLIPDRLSLVLAAMAALSGGDNADSFVNHAFSTASSAVSTPDSKSAAMLQHALQMLRAVAEEADGLDRGRRQALVPLLQRHFETLLPLLHKVLDLARTNGISTLASAAVKCLQAWLKLDVASGSSCLSPGDLHAASPPLFAALLALLASADEALQEAAAELLVEVLGPGRIGEHDGAAIQAAVSLLLSLREFVAVPGERGAATARAVGQLVSAVAERDSEALTRTSGEQVVLGVADLMLACVARPERVAVEAALEYFLMVNTTPVAERHAALCGPLFQSLLPHLLRHCMYPPGFTRWEDSEVDEEAFHMFREQLASDVLTAAYGMMRLQYLGAARTAMLTAGDWQSFEAAVFVIRCVSLSVKAQAGLSNSYSGGGGGGQAAAGASAPAADQTAAETNALLLDVFQDLCSEGGSATRFLAQPHVCQAAAHLVGEYAAWFGRTATAPLHGALRLLLRALGYPPAARHAAAAFRNICVRCGRQLGADAPTLRQLLTHATAAVAPPLSAAGGTVASTAAAVPLEDRTAVIEGLARIVGGLPVDAADGGAVAASEAAVLLVTPMLQRVSSLAGGSALGPAQLSVLADELRLVASAVRFMECSGPAGGGGGSPAVSAAAARHPALVLLEATWPLLSGVSVSPTCRADAGVVEALCEVYQRALLSAKSAARPLLGTLITSALQIFSAEPQPPCLDLIGLVAELFGQLRSPGAATAVSASSSGGSDEALQEQALAAVTVKCCTVLQAHVAELSTYGELLRALFSMADRYLVFARDVLLSSPALPALFQWGVATLSLRERDPVAAALAFLTHCIGAADKLLPAAQAGEALAVQQRGRLEACVSAHGQQLVQHLMVAACETCPRAQLRSLSGCLYALLTSPSFGAAAAACLQQVMRSPTIQGLNPDLLKEADCQRFVGLAVRSPPLPRGRFDSLLTDFGNIPRGEATSDTLMAYEM